MPKFSGKDLADQSFFDTFDKIRKEFKGLAKDAKIVSKAMQEAKGFKAYTEAVKKATDSTTRFAASETKLLKTIQATRFAVTEEGKQQAIATERKRRATAANRKFAQSQLEAAKSTNRFGSAIKSFLFKANFLANIMSSLASFISRQFRKAIRGAIDTIMGFDQAMADVRSITRSTDEDFKTLRDSARELGATTKFTAVEVAGLTKEYAKLGFSVDEILKVQKATLELAAATGTELPRAAEVVGVTLRQFGLNALEAGRITDVMARSFTSSLLDMEKFAESMKFVGPAARATGLTIEETTARLAQLADAGISGSMAGTSLRQIFIAMGVAGNDFNDRVKELSLSQLGLAEASEEVQKRAATALLVLADGAGTVDEFTESLVNAGGAAEEMAKVQLDTLKNQLALLKSAWDGLIITIGDSEGAIDGTKESIGRLAKALNLVERAIGNAQEKETAFKDGLKITRKTYLQTIPVLGTFFRVLNIGRTAVDILDERTKILDETIEGLGETVDGTVRNFDGLAEAFALIGDKLNLQNQIETLETLGEELDVLKEKRKTASLDEIAAINVEIQAIDKKIKKFKEAGIEAEELPKILKESMLKFSKEEQEIFDEIINDINEQFGIIAPMTKEELDILNELTLGNSEFLSKEMLKKRNEFNEEALELTKDRVEAEIALERAAEEEKAALKRDILNQGFQFFSALTDSRIAKINDQLNKEIGNEEKLLQEKAKLQKRAAIIQKTQALFNIALDTAAGIIKYGANPLTAPLIPFVIALGLAQAATVIATPIPQFAKGTKSSPKGKAIVGEKGHELMIHNGHVGLSPGVATLTDLKQGTEIIPADITNQILKYTAVANGFEGKADDGMIMMMAGKLDGLDRTIKDKPVASSITTASGILTSVHKGHTTIKKWEKFFK